jgi:hypothetical protein
MNGFVFGLHGHGLVQQACSAGLHVTFMAGLPASPRQSDEDYLWN